MTSTIAGALVMAIGVIFLLWTLWPARKQSLDLERINGALVPRGWEGGQKKPKPQTIADWYDANEQEQA